MAYNFPEGGKFLFSSTFAAAKVLATLSNASPAMAGSVAHGYTTNDELVLTSGWEDADAAIFRATTATADTFSLQGLDTTNVNSYTPGGAAGSTAQKISAWLEVPQVISIATNGGDARFGTVQPVFKRNGIKRPLGFNPTDITLEIGFDAANANLQLMYGLSRTFGKLAFKLVLADGSSSYGYGYLNVTEVPKISSGNANTVTAVFSAQGRTISYA